jgi:hypothetical protein
MSWETARLRFLTTRANARWTRTASTCLLALFGKNLKHFAIPPAQDAEVTTIERQN